MNLNNRINYLLRFVYFYQATQSNIQMNKNEVNISKFLEDFNDRLNFFTDYFNHYEVKDERTIYIPDNLHFHNRHVLSESHQIYSNFSELFKSGLYWEFCNSEVFEDCLKGQFDDLPSNEISYSNFLQYTLIKLSYKRLQTFCKVLKSLERENIIEILIKHFDFKQEYLYQKLKSLGITVVITQKTFSLLDEIKPFQENKDLILFKNWIKKHKDNKGFSYFYHRIKDRLINCSQKEYIEHLHNNNFINENDFNYYLDNYITSFKNCNSQSREDYFELLTENN